MGGAGEYIRHTSCLQVHNKHCQYLPLLRCCACLHRPQGRVQTITHCWSMAARNRRETIPKLPAGRPLQFGAVVRRVRLFGRAIGCDSGGDVVGRLAQPEATAGEGEISLAGWSPGRFSLLCVQNVRLSTKSYGVALQFAGVVVSAVQVAKVQEVHHEDDARSHRKLSATGVLQPHVANDYGAASKRVAFIGRRESSVPEVSEAPRHDSQLHH